MCACARTRERACAKALGTGTCFFFKAHNYEWSLAARRSAISFSWRLAQCCRLEGGMARWSDPIETHAASWLHTPSSEAFASHCQTLGGWRLPSRCTQWNNRFWNLRFVIFKFFLRTKKVSIESLIKCRQLSRGQLEILYASQSCLKHVWAEGHLYLCGFC